VIVFVDTSALFALLDEDDRHHQEAVATFSWLSTRAELLTTNYVEVEALALAGRRLEPAAAMRLIDAILPVVRRVWVDETLHSAAIAALRSSSSSISLVDRVSFEFMRAEGIETAFAFDSDFDANGFRRPSVDQVERGRQIHEDAAAYVVRSESSAVSDPVSVAEIAERTARSINTVQSWRRRHADFPAPAARLAAAPVWDWPTVAEWIAARHS
jgi:uncharacterized protein